MTQHTTFDLENGRRGSHHILSNMNTNNAMTSPGQSRRKVAHPQQHYTIENSKNIKQILGKLRCQDVSKSLQDSSIYGL